MLNEKQKKLKKMFVDGVTKNENYLKKYGPFTPIVYSYVDAILDMFPDVSEQTINNILNVKIKYKEGFAENFTKRGLYSENHFDIKDLSKMSSRILIFTSKEEYDNNIELVGNKYIKKEVPIDYEKLINTSIEGQTPLEDKIDQIKIKLCRLESLIHELNHASSFKKTYYVIGSKIKEDIKDISQEQYDGLEVYHISGGTTFSFEKIDGNKNRKIFIDNAAQLLHEGTTEYLMKKIFTSRYFDDLDICGVPKGKMIYNSPPAYRHLVDVVGMVEILQNNILSKNYFSPNISVKDIELIGEIVKSLVPLTYCVRIIQSMDSSNPDTENLLAEYLDGLQKLVGSFAYQKKQDFISICDSLPVDKRYEFLNYYNDFVDGNVWRTEIQAGCNNIDKDIYKKYMDKFVNDLDNLKSTGILKVDIMPQNMQDEERIL